MFGKNKRLPVVKQSDMISVTEIFTTLQGEGPYAGMRAVFIRMQGCNLACHFCDTAFESGVDMSAEGVVHTAIDAARSAYGGNGDSDTHAVTGRVLFVLTGGEPARQNLSRVLSLLRRTATNLGFIPIIQVETSGSLAPIWLAGVDSIVISPKLPKIHPGFSKLAAMRPNSPIIHLKFVVDASVTSAEQMLDGYVDPQFDKPIYVQPIDEYRAGPDGSMVRDADACQANIARAIDLCKQDGDLRLCLQTHKIVGLP